MIFPRACSQSIAAMGESCPTRARLAIPFPRITLPKTCWKRPHAGSIASPPKHAPRLRRWKPETYNRARLFLNRGTRFLFCVTCTAFRRRAPGSLLLRTALQGDRLTAATYMCNDTARIQTTFFWRTALQGNRLTASTCKNTHTHKCTRTHAHKTTHAFLHMDAKECIVNPLSL